MSASAKLLIVVALLLTAIAVGCKSSSDKSRTAETNSNASTSSGKPDDQGLIHSGTGEAKEKPEAGKANVQGRVLYNGKPAANIEVKLCEKFNQYLNGCGGQTFTAKTGDEGQYLIRNVPPGIYEGLTAKVFDTPYYVFATFSINADSSNAAGTNYDYINKRVDGTSYVLDQPLAAGSYQITVTAYNANDIKHADSPDDIKFTVMGGK